MSNNFLLKLKLLARKVLPIWLRNILNIGWWRWKIYQRRISLILFSQYWYDFRRFEYHSGSVRGLHNRATLAASMIMDYHRIEKGLSLKLPRLGFGSEWIISRFIPNIKTYIVLYGQDKLVNICQSVLQSYKEFHQEQQHILPQFFAEIKVLEKIINDVQSRTDSIKGEGGTITVYREQILKDSSIDLMSFVQSRHSIRHFYDSPVSREIIKQAIKISSFTPSVCNRQPWYIYIYEDYQSIEQLFQLQNGNSGFGEQVKTVLLVTGDISQMLSIGERNQCFIDGGMYSMSLVYALHSLGLGTCCLNLSIDSKTDLSLRKIAKIRDCHTPLMMIAVGNLPSDFQVAVSPRKSISETVDWLKLETQIN